MGDGSGFARSSPACCQDPTSDEQREAIGCKRLGLHVWLRTAARELRALCRPVALLGDGRIVGVFRVLFRRVDACIAVVVSRFCSHIPARVREHTSREMRQARTFAAVFRNHVKVERSARWIATGAACCAIDRRTAIRPTATFVEQRSTFATVDANVDAVVVGWEHDGALDCLNALIAVDHIGP
jgi:hypothetical protein